MSKLTALPTFKVPVIALTGTPEIVTKVPMPLARQATTNLLDVTLRRRR